MGLMSYIGIQLVDENNNHLLPNPYPIGAIYMSVDSRNPSLIFGGVWEQIKDKFLLCCGTSYAAGTTGGEATHALTTNEMPSHNHAIGYRTSTNIGSGSSGQWTTDPGTSEAWDADHGCIKNTGGGQAHNNMPPYLAVYVWKRVE